jgi:hypothetical protein
MKEGGKEIEIKDHTCGKAVAINLTSERLP